MTKTAIALLTVVFVPKTEHILSSHLDMSCVKGEFVFWCRSSVGVGGAVSHFDNVNPLTPVLPNLYVTVIGWEGTQALKKFILIRIYGGVATHPLT